MPGLTGWGVVAPSVRPIFPEQHMRTGSVDTAKSLFALVVAAFLVVSASAAFAGPVVSFSPTSLDFGNQSVGQSVTLPLTVTNTGTAVLNFSGISMNGGNRKDYSQTNTCGNTLAVGKSCTINVTFTPSQPSLRTSNVKVSDNAAGSPQF